jgi:hypothetical protein
LTMTFQTLNICVFASPKETFFGAISL